MALSNILFNNLTNKLKLETSLLEREKFYVKNLLNQANYLKKLKENNSKNLSIEKFINISDKETSTQDFVIAYIISISFLKANTTIHVSDRAVQSIL